MNEYCGRGVLYFYNLILLGVSGVLMYLAVLFVWTYGDYCTITANTYTIIPSGLIFLAGIVVLVTALVGLCGAHHESRCILGVLFALLFLMLSLEIVAGVLTQVKKSQIDHGIERNLWKSFNNYYSQHSYSRQSFDKMQQQLSCCGVQGPGDWVNASIRVPDSCCVHPGRVCYALPNNLYLKGCYGEVLENFNITLRYIMGVVIGFAVFQIFGMAMTMYVIVILKRVNYVRLLMYPQTYHETQR